MLLRVCNLTKTYCFKRHLYLKSEEKAVFKDISFELERGENMLVCGESGSGKSTLARILAMLEKADCGKIFFNGIELMNLKFKEQRLIRKELGYVFQEQKLALNPYKSVLELLFAVYENFKQKPNLNRIKSLFDDFELDFTLSKVKSGQLSTGQAQRIGLIRAFLLEPKLLILDEISSALDLSQTQKILSYLLKYQQKNAISYIFISHQKKLFRLFCKKELKLSVDIANL